MKDPFNVSQFPSSSCVNCCIFTLFACSVKYLGLNFRRVSNEQLTPWPHSLCSFKEKNRLPAEFLDVYWQINQWRDCSVNFRPLNSVKKYQIFRKKSKLCKGRFTQLKYMVTFNICFENMLLLKIQVTYFIQIFLLNFKIFQSVTPQFFRTFTKKCHSQSQTWIF